MIFLESGIPSPAPRVASFSVVKGLQTGLDCVLLTFCFNTVKTFWKGEWNFWWRH